MLRKTHYTPRLYLKSDVTLEYAECLLDGIICCTVFRRDDSAKTLRRKGWNKNS
jgi:hypothetical protein